MDFNELIEKIRMIPYGRNSNHFDFSLILTENKGTCSSKHAYLKDFANKNNIKNVKLIIGIYKMNERNTAIGKLLSDNNLDYIPEAHCYLKIDSIPIDVTSRKSFYHSIKDAILEEIEIMPIQVADFKVEYHQNYLKNWIEATNQTKTFEEIWAIREQCIAFLSLDNSFETKI